MNHLKVRSSKSVSIYMDVHFIGNPYIASGKSELPHIKNGRDHRDIFDIGLRDHFFRVQLFPKTLPCEWEVVRLRKLEDFQIRSKMSALGSDIHTHLLERTFLKRSVHANVDQNRPI